VDETSRGREREKAQKPQNQQDHHDRPQHLAPSSPGWVGTTS
jgi:hypothetical protein